MVSIVTIYYNSYYKEYAFMRAGSPYYTDDKQDAIETLKACYGEVEIKHSSHKPKYLWE